MLDLLIQEL